MFLFGFSLKLTTVPSEPCLLGLGLSSLAHLAHSFKKKLNSLLTFSDLMARRFRKLRRRPLGGKPRRRVFKRRFRRRQRMSYGIQRSLISNDTQYVKMRYTTNVVRNPVTYFDQYVFRGNSLYDPDQTGIGAQPAGFDQWMLMYGAYMVLASKIVVYYTNLTSVPFQVCTRPTTTNVNIGLDTSMEQAYAKSGVCSAVTARGTYVLKNFMRSKKLFGRTLDSVNYTGTSTSNPAVSWFWYTNVVSSDNSTALNYSYRVKITYYVKLWQRTNPSDA